MADQLFYTYNSSGVSAKAIKASNDHSYSIVFDTNRRSILAQGKEFGYTNIIGNAKGTNNGVSDVSIDSNGNITITYGSFLPGNTVIPNVSGFTYDDVFTLGSNTASSKTKIGTGYKTSGTSTSAYTASDIYETDLSVDTTKGTSSQYVYATSVNGHKITNSYKNLPTLGLGNGNAPTSNKVMQNMTVSDHTITPSYVTIATYEYLAATYQPIGNYQPSGIYTTITGINTKNTSTGYQINITYSGGSYSDYIPAATSTTFGVIKKTKDYHYTPDVSDASNTIFSSGTTANSTGAAFGSTIFISGISIGKDSKGHIVSLGTTTYTLPSETNLSLGTKSGSGNAITALSVSGHTITATYGSTFLTSHASHSIDFTGSQVSGTQSSGTINVLVGINDTSDSSGTISCTYKYKTISLDGTGGGSAANCVTYTSETNAIKTITVASSPGTNANVLYVIL